MVVRSATVRVPEASPVCDHELGEEFGFLVGGHEGAGADFDVEDESVEAFGEFLAHDAGGDEVGRFDGAGVVAEGVEDAVGGDDRGGLADEGGAAFGKDVDELWEGELGVEAGDGFELVQGAAGVAEAASGDHGDADAGDAVRGGSGEASGGDDGCDEKGGLVADAAGGVLVDGEGVEGCRCRRLSPEKRMAAVSVASSRGLRPRRKTAMRKAAIWASVTSCFSGVRSTMAWMKALNLVRR